MKDEFSNLKECNEMVELLLELRSYDYENFSSYNITDFIDDFMGMINEDEIKQLKNAFLKEEGRKENDFDAKHQMFENLEDLFYDLFSDSYNVVPFAKLIENNIIEREKKLSREYLDKYKDLIRGFQAIWPFLYNVNIDTIKNTISKEHEATDFNILHFYYSHGLMVFKDVLSLYVTKTHTSVDTYIRIIYESIFTGIIYTILMTEEYGDRILYHNYPNSIQYFWKKIKELQKETGISKEYLRYILISPLSFKQYYGKNSELEPYFDKYLNSTPKLSEIVEALYDWGVFHPYDYLYEMIRKNIRFYNTMIHASNISYSMNLSSLYHFEPEVFLDKMTQIADQLVLSIINTMMMLNYYPLSIDMERIDSSKDRMMIANLSKSWERFEEYIKEFQKNTGITEA